MNLTLQRLSARASAGGLLVLLLAAWLGAMPLQAQFMGDQSSIYSDAWGDDSNIYGYGSTTGTLSYHSYDVDVTITSPLGRTAAAYGSYSYWFSSTSAALDWDLDDFGDYTLTFYFRTHCNVAQIYFLAAMAVLTTTPPAPPCSSAQTVTCNEFNNELPLGQRLGNPACTSSPNCCTAANQPPVNGYCRTETCIKCGNANLKNSINSQCFQDKSKCQDGTYNVFCENSPTCP